MHPPLYMLLIILPGGVTHALAGCCIATIIIPEMCIRDRSEDAPGSRITAEQRITSSRDRSTGRLRKSEQICGGLCPALWLPAAGVSPQGTAFVSRWRLKQTFSSERSPQFFVSGTVGFSHFYCTKNYGLAPFNCHWALSLWSSTMCRNRPPSAISSCGEPCCATFPSFSTTI